MSIKKNEVAKGVRVKLNDKFIEKSLADKYLMGETVIYIAEHHVYNDSVGEYVHLNGGSGGIGSYAYLDQLDLEFPYEGIRYPTKYNVNND